MSAQTACNNQPSSGHSKKEKLLVNKQQVHPVKQGGEKMAGSGLPTIVNKISRGGSHSNLERTRRARRTQQA